MNDPLKWHRRNPGVYYAVRYDPLNEGFNHYRVIHIGNQQWEASVNRMSLGKTDTKGDAQRIAQSHIDTLWDRYQEMSNEAETTAN